MYLRVNIKKLLPAFTLKVDFSLPVGESMVLFGPSGSGKTTLLRILAGLEQIDQGYVYFGRDCFVNTHEKIFLPPRKRNLALVFQEGILFPHLSLEKNINLQAKDKEQTKDLLQILGLWSLRKRKPAEVSGGERQRAALAQALARKPRLLLLDEPFSALDQKTKETVINFLKTWQEENKTTMVVITHQWDEAQELSSYWLEIWRGETKFCTRPFPGHKFFVPPAQLRANV